VAQDNDGLVSADSKKDGGQATPDQPRTLENLKRRYVDGPFQLYKQFFSILGFIAVELMNKKQEGRRITKPSLHIPT